MEKQVIEQFSRGFFPGLIEINFFTLRDKRAISFVFNSVEAIAIALQNAEHGSRIFVIDEENKTLTADRDHYETIMYLTAVKGATDAWIQQYGEAIERERLLEEDDED